MLDPGDVIALLGAVRRWRDRAMLEAMVLGGLRCCEVIGLRLEDLQPTQRRVFIAEGKGGHQRVVPLSAQFFAERLELPVRRTAIGRGERPVVRVVEGRPSR